MTPDMRKAWEQGRLDQRCRDCGATSAASSWCYACSSTDLEYRVHLPGPKPGEPGPRPQQWCQQGEVVKPVDPVRRERALAAAVPAPQAISDRPELWRE